MRSGNWSIRSWLRPSIEPSSVSAIIFSIIPCGRLIIQDSFLHDQEVLYLEEARLFAVSMLLVTPARNTYSFSETAEWLRTAEFVKIRPVRMKRGTEDWDGGLLEAFRSAGGKARNGLRG
ncbi:protein of unknown function [Nitrospira defluvii]|uniref:Uncharacterized protein n=1 Tax=Nitrospira defluvii TaxID=330214 RepID=B3U4J3_9BACT|nr:protein of unknown function [Nitrospira defluvii]CBK41153.1 protein of unknown function [Nitrospira defluvii]